MNSVTLKKIDESNFIDCFHLKLAPGQEKFVSDPVRSLAQAYVYYPQCTPFGVYDGDRMVGYLMIIYDYDEETYNIWHLMIDAAEQGKGYGAAALRSALDSIAQKPFGASDRVLLTCNPDNRIAYQLYLRFGFAPTGRVDDDEVELEYRLK